MSNQLVCGCSLLYVISGHDMTRGQSSAHSVRFLIRFNHYLCDMRRPVSLWVPECSNWYVCCGVLGLPKVQYTTESTGLKYTVKAFTCH